MMAGFKSSVGRTSGDSGREGLARSLQRAVLVLAFAGSLLVACQVRSAMPTPAPAPTAVAVTEPAGYSNITASQLAEMLKNKDFFFVNVHTPYAGEIAATDAFIPYDATAQRLSDYPANKQAKIVLYCRSGRMSAIAAAELVKAGYTQVLSLDGGMSAWEQAGFELLQK